MKKAYVLVIIGMYKRIEPAKFQEPSLTPTG